MHSGNVGFVCVVCFLVNLSNVSLCSWTGIALGEAADAGQGNRGGSRRIILGSREGRSGLTEGPLATAGLDRIISYCWIIASLYNQLLNHCHRIMVYHIVVCSVCYGMPLSSYHLHYITSRESAGRPIFPQGGGAAASTSSESTWLISFQPPGCATSGSGAGDARSTRERRSEGVARRWRDFDGSRPERGTHSHGKVAATSGSST